MAKSKDDLFGSAITLAQEQAIVRLVEQQLVKHGLLNARRCASCEWFSPIGNHCMKHDGEVPEDFRAKGCGDWQQLMPI